MNKKGQPKKSEYDKLKQLYIGFKQGHIKDLGGEANVKLLCKEYIEKKVKG